MPMRVGVQLALALASAALFVVTLVWHDWIELVFRVEPDGGSGAAEIAIVAATAVAAIFFGLRARAQWRKPRPERR